MKSNVHPYKHFLPGYYSDFSFFFKKYKIKYKTLVLFGDSPHLYCNETISPGAALSGAFV